MLSSILISNYNKDKYIQKCIESCLSQTYSNFEIIVGDNESNDNSLKILENYNLKNIHIIKKKFESPALNQLDVISEIFKKSKGEIIFLLDSDDYFEKEKLRKITNIFKEHKLKNIICDIPKIINFDNKKIILNDLISLISKNSNEDIDKLFFTILSPQKEIIYTSLANINSSGDSFVLVQRIKYYLSLIISIENANEINIVFPKYLFMQKDKFVEIYKKLNYERISKIIVLIKKTEILLRKNTTMHLIITQRFLLNLKKTIG